MSSVLSEPRADVRLGSRLGKYRITAILGRGGMGVVYAAVDTVLRRPVALKLLSEAAAEDPAAWQRLLHEAQAAARLNHPNVVSIYDVDRIDDAHCIAMEFVRGGSVQEFLRRRGPLPWREATRIAVDICRGLAAAHSAGLIHRDIKPANVMRSADGCVKLADFGLAKLADRTAPSRVSSPLLGTPDYMSPEQCRCDELDERSDLYSVGATYFAMLTGRPPFPADSPVQKMFAHCSRAVPDVCELVPAIPPVCGEIVRKAMAKEPSERYASATEVATALEAVLDGAAEPAAADEWSRFLQEEPQQIDGLDDPRHWFTDSTLKRARRRRRITALSLVAAAAAVGILLATFGRPANDSVATNLPQPADGISSSATLTWSRPPAETIRLQLDSPGTMLAFSAEGRWLAVGGDEGDVGFKVWDWKTGELQPERRFRMPKGRPHQHVTALAFAPHDAWLAVAAEYESTHEVVVWNMNEMTALPQRLDLGRASATGLVFSSDGRRLAATCNEPDGKSQVRLWDCAAWQEGKSWELPESPASWLACSAGEPRLAVAFGRKVQLWDLSTQQPLVVLETPTAATHGAFARYRDMLAIVSLSYVRLRALDGDGKPRLLEIPAGTADCVAVSADGSRFVVGGGTKHGGLVTLFDARDGYKPVQLRGHEARVRAVAFQPHGEMIAATGDDRTVRLWAIPRAQSLQPTSSP